VYLHHSADVSMAVVDIVVRSPSVEHGIAACELVTEHHGLGHTSPVYATDQSVIERFALAIRTGRILVNAPTAVGALGGVYNSMPPTFSLGCGTWGSSNTTDNVNCRNLLNIKAVSRRQAPPQWFRVPSDTYFNPGALENLRLLGAQRPMIVTDGPTEARGVADRVRGFLLTDSVHVFSGIEPEPSEEQVRAGDPTLMLSMPPTLTADTGIDALTHALEAAVSIFGSPFTDAFCMQAVKLILDALPRAYRDGSDLEARSAMANAATIAGLAFSNAFLGLNHALAHAVGARFGIAHGRANAIFLPHVLRYNASLPSKFMPAPGYSAYVAPQKYAQIAWVLGIHGSSEDDRREKLFGRIGELLAEVGQPTTLSGLGIDRREFDDAVLDLAKTAFTDPSIRTNPRIPLLREIVTLLHAGYGD
jgi:alcohol dehydrogenase class IV